MTRNMKRGAGIALRVGCVVGFSAALDACDLGYGGIESIVDLGASTGTCTNPGVVQPRSVEVSEAVAYGVPVDGGGAFTPLADGDTLSITRGFQGADMVVLSLRVTGVDSDRCIAQQTTLVDSNGTLEARLVRPVQFTSVAPGVLQTSALFLPGEFNAGPLHTLTVSIGGITLTRHLTVR